MALDFCLDAHLMTFIPLIENYYYFLNRYDTGA